MSQKLWQVNFRINVTAEEYAEATAPLKQSIAQVPGLLWKIWIVNDEERQAGGIHLFADQASLDNYAASKIVAGILSHPALSDFEVKTFDVMEESSMATRAPIGDKIAM